jgi:NADH-quinone oxidoreductase subunit C/D
VSETTPTTDGPTRAPASLRDLVAEFGEDAIFPGASRDRIPTAWISRARAPAILGWLAGESPRRFEMLYDLTAIDERLRRTGTADPSARDFTVVYHLLSVDRAEELRLKVALSEGDLELPTVTGVWPSASWYEREAYDMFGIRFSGHPHLVRILMPRTWRGHPLRKDHPARATELGEYRPSDESVEADEQALTFDPEE